MPFPDKQDLHSDDAIVVVIRYKERIADYKDLHGIVVKHELGYEGVRAVWVRRATIGEATDCIVRGQEADPPDLVKAMQAIDSMYQGWDGSGPSPDFRDVVYAVVYAIVSDSDEALRILDDVDQYSDRLWRAWGEANASNEVLAASIIMMLQEDK